MCVCVSKYTLRRNTVVNVFASENDITSFQTDNPHLVTVVKLCPGVTSFIQDWHTR